MATPRVRFASVVALAYVGVGVTTWGPGGHAMQARAALAAMPSDMPTFFSEAREELAYLIREPDRWRRAGPAIMGESFPNHVFSFEIAPDPLPPSRGAYLVYLAESGRLASAATNPIDPLMPYGTAPYAIAEWAEMMTGAFRTWRATPDDDAHKRRIEEDILFIAGVLGHWITDTSNPMHSSIHVRGWHPDVPNPRGYVPAGPAGQDLHTRYEGTYVDATIAQADVSRLVPREAVVNGDWLGIALAHIRRANQHVEQIYEWELEYGFGSGSEPDAARQFTARRLAEGAQTLRDVWYSAWRLSAEPD